MSTPADAAPAVAQSDEPMVPDDYEALPGGELIYAGSASPSMTGRGAPTKAFDGVKDLNLFSYHRLYPTLNVKIRHVTGGSSAAHFFAFGVDGSTYSWGRNEDFQLGLNDDVNRFNPTKLPAQDDGDFFVHGALSSTFSLLITNKGVLKGVGACKQGQLGIGRILDDPVQTLTPANFPLNPNGSPVSKVVSVSCGREFSIAVAESGCVYAMGCPMYGQLGNNTDGKTLEKAGRETFMNEANPILIQAFEQLKQERKCSRVIKCASGTNHSVAMDDQGRLFSWGFGGYGRLGLRIDARDRHVPTPIELFSSEPEPVDTSKPAFLQRQQPKIRAMDLSCGASVTYVRTRPPLDTLYMFGITKKSGEATMYPMEVTALYGLSISHVAAGATSTCATASKARQVITWGPSPTLGELGYGEGQPKSSTKAKVVEYLTGAKVTSLASGHAAFALVVDMEDEASKKCVEGLRVYCPPELPEGHGKRAILAAKAKEQEEQLMKLQAEMMSRGEELPPAKKARLAGLQKETGSAA